MKDGARLTESLRHQIQQTIRTGLSPRHVPKFILEVKDIPVTINGKKVEIAVKKIISGMDVIASSTVSNPECLQDYVQYRSFERDMARL
jgi:acetoacetyl-CoA synthetase